MGNERRRRFGEEVFIYLRIIVWEWKYLTATRRNGVNTMYGLSGNAEKEELG